MRTNTLTLNLVKVSAFSLLLGAAIVAPLFGNQFVTGTIVNATLLAATALFGVWYGLSIAVVPSALALAIGLLPFALAPMVPFIILGNAMLVVVFGWAFKNNGYWLRMPVAAVLKFGWIYATSLVVLKLFVNETVAAEVATMMSWPQLVTAVCGGLVAFGVIKAWKLRL